MSASVIMIILFSVLALLVLAFALWYCFLKNSSSKTAIVVTDTVILLLCVVGIVFCVVARSVYKKGEGDDIQPREIDKSKIENVDVGESPLSPMELQKEESIIAPGTGEVIVSDNSIQGDEVKNSNDDFDSDESVE